MSTLAEGLKQYRKIHGMSQQELAAQLGINQSYMSTIESGYSNRIGHQILSRIAAVTGIQADVAADGKLRTDVIIQIPEMVATFRDKNPEKFNGELSRFFARIYTLMAEEANG